MKTQTLRPYPEYKDSGTPWLEDIPAHWETLPNRALFAEVNDRNHPEEQLLSVTIAKGVIRQSDLLVDTSKKDSSSEDKANYKLLQPRDIAYNKMRAWQGSVGVSNYRGIVSPAYIVVRLRGEQNPNYFHYLLRTPAFAKEAERWSYGITSDQWSLRAKDFKQIYCSVPPKDEQRAIVRFLAHADRRTSRLIRAKRGLIGLLNEQKQAIINRAITRGLDPNVCLKPSGIDWLDDVPEHWQLKRFKFVATLNSGQVDPRDLPYRDYLLIAPNHIERGTGRILFEQTADEQGADSGKYVVAEGQIIYSKIRPNLRKATIARTKCLCSADMYPLSPVVHELRPHYLLLLLLSEPVTRYVVDCSMRVAMPKVNRDALGNCWLWYPRLEEQDAILAHLAAALAPFDTEVSSAQLEIDLIREYRARLIADVVTGKLDVRGVELPALDEDEPLEDWDEGVEEEADEVAETEEIALADV